MAAADPILAWFLDAYKDRTLEKPSDALTRLMAHPKTFLKEHPVMIDERPGAAGIITAYMTNNTAKDVGKGTGVVPMRPGKILGTHRMHETSGFYIYANGIPPGSYAQTRAPFSTHYAEMK